MEGKTVEEKKGRRAVRGQDEGGNERKNGEKEDWKNGRTYIRIPGRRRRKRSIEERGRLKVAKRRTEKRGKEKGGR